MRLQPKKGLNPRMTYCPQHMVDGWNQNPIQRTRIKQIFLEYIDHAREEIKRTASDPELPYQRKDP